MGGDLHDEYRDSRVNYAWIMWQASRQELEGQDARLIHLLADIRFACGDDGKRMQGELVEYIGELARKAGELEGEPVGYTNQYQLDKFPLSESGYVFRDKRDDSTIPLYTYSASAQKEIEGEPVDVERIADTVRDYLGDIFACTRVWKHGRSAR